MRKFTDIVCLVLWAMCLVIGIMSAIMSLRISPVSFIAACIACCLHYIENILTGYKEVKK